MFVLGVTATRQGLTPYQADVAWAFMAFLGAAELRHGDCVGGDETCAALAAAGGIDTVGHPPDNPRRRAFFPSSVTLPPEPYAARNRAIVRAAGVLLAMPKEPVEQPYGGTWMTVRLAAAAGRPVVVVPPAGPLVGHKCHDPRVVLAAERAVYYAAEWRREREDAEWRRIAST